MLIEALFNHEFIVSRVYREDNGQGGWIITRIEIGTVRGRLCPVYKGEEDSVAQQEEHRITHHLYVLAGTDIARDDEVEGGGNLVKVLGVREPSHTNHHLEIDCQEMQKGQSYEDSS